MNPSEWTRKVRRLALAASVAAFGYPLATWAQVPGEKTVGGIVFRLGLASSDQVASDHPATHEERSMHQPRKRREREHLVVSLADSGSGRRIADATVTALVSRMGTDQVRQELERMEAGGMASYGGYFDLSAPGPYVIRIEVRRPGAPAPTFAQFDYRNR
jgi:hypothetical protein